MPQPLFITLTLAGLVVGAVVLAGVWRALRQRDNAPLHHQAHHADRRAAIGPGRSPEELAVWLGVSLDTLHTVNTAYRTHTVPKHRGGVRVLHAPNPALKAVQRTILRRLLNPLRTHRASMGFEPGVSIVHNAALHACQAVVIKLDLKDFFPATTTQRVEHYFRRIGWDPQAAALLTRLTTLPDPAGGGLPQGAPTSPRLSSLVNFVMDAQIERYVHRHRGTYTRYADDLTVSYPEDWPRYVRGTIQHLRKTARRHGYTVHTRKKLRVLRRHQRQTVTGLVVNDGVDLPRTTRRRLRAAEHRMKTTGRSTHSPQQLAGWQALRQMIATQRRPAAAPPFPSPPDPGGGTA